MQTRNKNRRKKSKVDADADDVSQDEELKGDDSPSNYKPITRSQCTFCVFC